MVGGVRIKREGRWEGFVSLEISGTYSYRVNLTPTIARRLAIALLTEAEERDANSTPPTP
jgi:hypothetical protein